MSAGSANGFFGRSQAALGGHEVFRPVGEVKPTQVVPALAVYVDLDYLGVDPERKVWVSRTAPALTASEALAINQDEDISLFRLIIAPRSRIVDLSAGLFTLNTISPDKLAMDTEIRFDTDDWIKATGKIVREPAERQAVELALKEKYGVFIGESVLAIDSIAGDEEEEDEYSDEYKE